MFNVKFYFNNILFFVALFPLYCHPTEATERAIEHSITDETSHYDLQQQSLIDSTTIATNLRKLIQMLGAEIVTHRVKPAQPKKLLSQLSFFDTQLVTLSQETPTILTDTVLIERFATLQGIITSLLALVTSNGTSMTVPNRTTLFCTTIEELRPHIAAQQQQLQAIHDQMPFLGLNRYQRFYKKYRLFTRERGFGMQSLVATASAATLLTLFLYSIKREDFDNIMQTRGMRFMPLSPLLRGLKRLLGEPYNEGTIADLVRAGQAQPRAAINAQAGAPQQVAGLMQPPTLLASLHRIADKSLGFTTAAIAPFLWRSSLQPWLTNVSEQLQHAVAAQHHKMMGNNYRPTGVQRFINTGFEEVIGNDELKHEFKILAEYICMPEKFARTRSVPSKFMLITGKSGAGKSFFVQQAAGYFNQRLEQLGKTYRIPFIELKPKDIMEARQVYGDLREYFKIKIPKPAIVFIDEISLLRLNKTGDTELLNQWLTLMSGFESNQDKGQVILIAATNNPQDLDPALLREGRFGKPWSIEFPVAHQRREFIIRELQRTNIRLSQEYIDYLVQQTDGQAFEMIRTLIHTPLRESAMRNTPVTQEMFDAAINKLLFGIKKLRHELTDHERKLLSIMIAGQVIAIKLLTPTLHIARATIGPVSKAVKTTVMLWQDQKEKASLTFGAVFTYTHKDKVDVAQSNALKQQIQQLIAGALAQELITGDRTIHKDDPIMSNAYELCVQVVSRGLDLEKVSNKVADEISLQAYELLRQLEAATTVLIKPHLATIKNLAERLAQKITLQEAEISSIINQASTGAVDTVPA
ncbi:AAA family ATPase [Candidatus Dependentiae bacterium]|nr:AAA family ATPase [Candidatus Dependentiae bacterium]